MSLVIVGVSHRSAPLPLLERVAIDTGRLATLTARIVRSADIDECLVVATCNRLEVWVSAVTFHGAVNDVIEAVCAVTGVQRGEMGDHLYAHFEERAVSHAFSLACGLDSMAVGESQILGQLRDALAAGQDSGAVGPVLNSLVQRSLRLGKRAHTETDLGRAGVSLITLGLDRTQVRLGALGEAHALVVGAGSMSALAATTLRRRGVASLTVVNRTAERARRLAESLAAVATSMDALPQALEAADLVVSCTGARGQVIGRDLVEAAHRARGGRPQVFLDLALPHDVDPQAATLEGVSVVSLAQLADEADDPTSPAADIAAVRELVVGEVAAYLAVRRQTEVAPTVAALRTRAADVMAAELARLDGRLPGLTDAERAEVRRAVHRVVDKLLHTPTVRVKQLVGDSHGGDYAQALRDLFDLDPCDVAAVSCPPESGMMS